MIEGLVVLLVIFVLAMFVGFEVISRVPSVLHTPRRRNAAAATRFSSVSLCLCSLEFFRVRVSGRS